MADYNQLLTDIPAWLEDQSPELLQMVPTFIAFAEGRCARELQVRQFNATFASTMSIGGYLYTIPADLEVMRSFEITVGSRVVTLEKRMREWLRFYWDDTSQLDVPKYYSVENNGSFIVAPVPVAAYPYRVYYRCRLQALDSSNPNNWLTDQAYDALLYAALAEGAKFLLSDRRDNLAASYEEKWAEKRDAINRDEARVMRDEERQPGNLAANV
jgi:hypothetical protein